MFLNREKKISEAPKWLMMLVMLKRSARRKREMAEGQGCQSAKGNLKREMFLCEA